MIGSYVLSFQVYLALPLEVRRLGGEGTFGTAAVAVLFAVSGLSTILFQTKVTAWCKARMEPGRALAWGLLGHGAGVRAAAGGHGGPGAGRRGRAVAARGRAAGTRRAAAGARAR